MKRSLPQGLYRAEQVRDLDRLTIEEQGVPGFELMTRAAQSCFDSLLEEYGAEGRICVLCGAGNNAGDGYLVAALAKQAGMNVSIISLSEPEKLRGDAASAYQQAVECGVAIQSWQPGMVLQAELLVDALLGTGLSGEVRGPYVEAITAINATGAAVLAVDIPSGLCADTGAELGCAVRADITVTFIGLKQGLLTAQGPLCTGKLEYDDLDVPSLVFRQQPADVELIDPKPLLAKLPVRQADSHKGRHGHVLVVGGNRGMGGAALLAAEAALYSGAGLVSVATRAEHVSAFIARQPELMARAVEGGSELRLLLAGKDALILGPGLGQDEWAQELLLTALRSNIPLLLDADALNLIADNSDLIQVHQGERVLTPHPGEAARLLRTSTEAIQRDRFLAVARLQQEYDSVVLLKGVGTLVAHAAPPLRLCGAGNPGMAVGGMGDLLSGVIGSLMAQGMTSIDAATLGCWLHSKSADEIARFQGLRGLLPSDLLVQIRKNINSVN
ncbi:NAD(P)H-hydrate dehydratase [Aestuariirhabdus sp. Z084]|uniref:NAD(P)H-hydrate dehydratase n=1 Tax=Aestuariirhabdus haliotis TaxID=2918751 RepID=UPI00201B3978|nr:NAD(P)H-hydrate dehydratase [Aestuariirhabdus haliotis]MCL6415632.1 NAD(P)H-hydrate dehydratase [Aestuariirhabdus haliotis]MCL6419627.1 NAD(P)H-hydrate dehydratase [Aestuariirhabdus haliotis]